MPRQLKHDRRKRKPEPVKKGAPDKSKCPDCGSRDVREVEREVSSTLPWPFNLLAGLMAPRSEALTRCQYCGHTW